MKDKDDGELKNLYGDIWRDLTLYETGREEVDIEDFYNLLVRVQNYFNNNNIIGG